MARDKSDSAGSSRKNEEIKEENYAPRPLSEADKDRFFSLLDTDPAKAADRYEMIRQKLIRYFSKRSCPDPENLANETLSRAYQVMSQIERFIFGIARNVKHEDDRERKREVQPIDESDGASRPPDNTDNLNIECLKQCLQKLPPKERALIIVYADRDQLEREALAKHLGISLIALRSKVLRIRRKLEQYAKEC